MANGVLESFIGSVAWPAGNSGRRFGHTRSLSAITRSQGTKPASPSPLSPMDIGRPSSASPLPNRPNRSYSSRSPPDEHDLDLSTIPDPRSRAMSPAAGADSPMEHHPDLDNEVAALSNKLINAINHQTTLDDNLSSTRQELNQSQQKVHELEDQLALQREMLSGDVWIRRKTAEAEKGKILSSLAVEKRLREDAEQQKRKMELELESLTAALFEEANKMVITAKEQAREEQEALQHKNDLLKAQLADTEGLLRSQQEQLAELKHVIETMNAERDDLTAQTGPSSPGFSKFSKPDAKYDHPASDGVSHLGAAEAIPLSPSYPTSFSHLLQPVLRTDMAAFNDFKDLIRTSKRFSGHRVSSGLQNTGLTSLVLGPTNSASAHGNGSTSSLSTAGTPVSQSTPHTPNTPASAASMSSSVAPVHLPPLKETKFYKRALVEDIEPTLRLDTAPGLSWLARRNVLSAITEGSLVIEPVPATITPVARVKPQLDPCSLCGESRKDEEHLRTHRFRPSESESAQRYPLCKYCLGRLRSTCDYLSFLRIVKDGHWHAEDDDAEKVAWEESVRLRDQMFWSRIGGGVVPTAAGGVTANHTTTPPTPVTPAAPVTTRVGSNEENKVTRVSVDSSGAQDSSSATDDRKDPPHLPPRPAPTMDADTKPASIEAEGSAAAQPDQLDNSVEALDGNSSDKVVPQRLSLTIPGSQETAA